MSQDAYSIRYSPSAWPRGGVAAQFASGMSAASIGPARCLAAAQAVIIS